MYFCLFMLVKIKCLLKKSRSLVLNIFALQPTKIIYINTFTGFYKITLNIFAFLCCPCHEKSIIIHRAVILNFLKPN